VLRGGNDAGEERLQISAVNPTVGGATSAAGDGTDGINGGIGEDIVRRRSFVGCGEIDCELEQGGGWTAVTTAKLPSPGARRRPFPLQQMKSCLRHSQRRHQQLRETGFVSHQPCRRRRSRELRRGVNHLVGSRLQVGRGVVRQRRRDSSSRTHRDVCGRRWHGRGVSTKENVQVGGVRGGSRRGGRRLGCFGHGKRGLRRGSLVVTGGAVAEGEKARRGDTAHNRSRDASEVFHWSLRSCRRRNDLLRTQKL